MIKKTILGEEIFICKNKPEARDVWKSHTQDRHRLWLETEACDCLLMGPEELQEIMERKQSQPGYTYCR